VGTVSVGYICKKTSCYGRSHQCDQTKLYDDTTIVFIGSILTLEYMHVLLTCHVTADYYFIQVQQN